MIQIIYQSKSNREMRAAHCKVGLFIRKHWAKEQREITDKVH